MVNIKFVGEHAGSVWYVAQGVRKYAFANRDGQREQKITPEDAELLRTKYPGVFEIVAQAKAPATAKAPAKATATTKKEG